jgi:hypothetical protein
MTVCLILIESCSDQEGDRTHEQYDDHHPGLTVNHTLIQLVVQISVGRIGWIVMNLNGISRIEFGSLFLRLLQI